MGKLYFEKKYCLALKSHFNKLFPRTTYDMTYFTVYSCLFSRVWWEGWQQRLQYTHSIITQMIVIRACASGFALMWAPSGFRGRNTIKFATHIQTTWMVLALHRTENLVCLPFPTWKSKANDSWLGRFPYWSLQTLLDCSGPKHCSCPIPDSSSWPTAGFGCTI